MKEKVEAGRRAILAVVIFMLAGFTSCREKEAPGGIEAEAFEIVKHFEKGPLTVTLSMSRKEITIADTLTMEVKAEGKKGCRAQLPRVSDLRLGDFQVKDYSVEKPRLEGDVQISRLRLLLEPFLSGEYKIAPFKVKFTVEGDPKNEDGSEKIHEVVTNEVRVQVASLTGEDSAKMDIRDIKKQVELVSLHRTSTTAVILGGGGAVLLLTALLFWVIRKRSGRKKTETLLPAHLIAFEALHRLREKKLIEQRLFREFYYEVCFILRTYMENRFGIRAPEETTEEFLQAIVHEKRFDDPTKDILKKFLEHCDLVKFARYVPLSEEIQKTFNITRDFIEKTKEEKVHHGV